MPTNNQIKTWHTNSKKIKEQIKRLNKLSNQIDNKLKLLNNKKRYIDDISTIYNGICISQFWNKYRLVVPINGIMRTADIYPNAQVKGKYGAHIKFYNEFDGPLSRNAQEIWLGAGYTSEKKLKKIVFEFLTTGAILPEKDRKYW